MGAPYITSGSLSSAQIAFVVALVCCSELESEVEANSKKEPVSSVGRAESELLRLLLLLLLILLVRERERE